MSIDKTEEIFKTFFERQLKDKDPLSLYCLVQTYKPKERDIDIDTIKMTMKTIKYPEEFNNFIHLYNFVRFAGDDEKYMPVFEQTKMFGDRI